MARVLIVEDAADLAELIATALRLEGHTVETVTSHHGDLLHPQRWAEVDVALVDVQLGGGVDGRSIVTWLKANVPSVRRVVLTGQARAGGDADRVLGKPCSLQAILDAVG